MKRFTECEKWRDSWFRKLTPDTKLAFFFLTENCDASGVWDPDTEMADFQIGKPMNWEAIRAELGERVQILPNGKWFLPKFVAFQYVSLNPQCKPHQAVIRLLERHGIPFHTLSEGLAKGIHTLEDKDKDKDKDNVLVFGGVQGGQPAPEPEPVESGPSPELIYAAYPRKEARQMAIAAIRKAMATTPAETLMAAVLAYAKATAKWPKEDQRFIPHATTWFNQERYLDDPAGWVRNVKVSATTEEVYAKGF